MAQQKIDFFGQFQPSGVDPTAGNRLRALAGISENIGKIAFQQGAKIQTKRGTIAGQKVERDEEGKVVAPELKSDFTIFGRNFNKAALLAHRAEANIDIKENLDRLQLENSLDPEAFTQLADNFKQGLLNGMPEELAVVIDRDFVLSARTRLARINKDLFKIESEKNRATNIAGIENSKDDILNAVRSGDTDTAETRLIQLESTLIDLVDTGQITASESERIKENLRERSLEQAALRQIDEVVDDDKLTPKQKADKALEVFDLVRKSDLTDLSPEQKDGLLNIISAKVRDLQRQVITEKAEITFEQNKAASDLEVKINLGLGDQSKQLEEIENLFRDDVITREKRTSLITKLGNANKKATKEAISFLNVEKKLAGGSPGLVLSKKEVDTHYKEKFAPTLEGADPLVRSAKQADYILSLRTVPQGIKDEIRNNVLSGDIDLIRQSADLIDRVDEIQGMSELIVNSSERAFINDVVNLTDVIGSDEAIKLAQENASPKNTARTEANKSRIKDEKFEDGDFITDSYQDIIEDEFEVFGGLDLDARTTKAQIIREYKNTFESLFIKSGDKDASQEKALQLLKRNWSESDFGFMKNAPELFYSVQGDASYVRKQFAEDIRKGTIGESFSNKDLFLFSDDITDKEAATGLPSYRMMLLDKDGMLQALTLIDENGNPTERWRPDKEKEEARQRAENISELTRKQKFEKARKNLETSNIQIIGF